MSNKDVKIPISLHIPKNAGTYLMILSQIYYVRLYSLHENYLRRVYIDHPRGRLTVICLFMNDYYVDDENMKNWFDDDDNRRTECELDTLIQYIENDMLRVLHIFVEPIDVIDLRTGFFLAKDIANTCNQPIHNYMVMRNTFERQQSLFNYMTSSNSTHEPTHMAIYSRNFDDYLQTYQLEDSWVIRALTGVRDDIELDEHWLQTTIDFLNNNNIEHVNIRDVDTYIDDLLYSTCGVPVEQVIPNKKIVIKNDSVKFVKSSIDEISPAARQCFESRAKWDIELCNRLNIK